MSAIAMAEQDGRIAQVFAEQGARLRNFIRKRVPNESDAEDLVQEVFYELVEASRLLMRSNPLPAGCFRWRGIGLRIYSGKRGRRTSAMRR